MKFAKNIEERENILMNLSNSKNHLLSSFERQLCSVQGKMFELSADKNLSSKDFIDFYMQSNTAKYFDLPFDRTQWLGEESLLQDVLEEGNFFTTGNVYNKESLFWIGYTYRYWHFLTGEASEAITKICNAETMNMLYIAYHTLDCTMAIERIIEGAH